MRDRLAADSKALAAHKLLDLTPLAQLKGGTGYKSLAQDLQILSKVMLDSWPQIQGKSATTAEDLKTANQMSTRLMRIVGVREQSPAVVAAASEARLRAFTQLIRVYEDARRAVAYLRAAEGDADTIAPSLYPGRSCRPASAGCRREQQAGCACNGQCHEHECAGGVTRTGRAKGRACEQRSVPHGVTRAAEWKHTERST
jgi:hypothetical protein